MKNPFQLEAGFENLRKKKGETERCKYNTEYKCSVEDLAIWWLW